MVTLFYVWQTHEQGLGKRCADTYGIFVKAYQSIMCSTSKPALKDDAAPNKKEIFLHLEYNKHDIRRNQVRKIWDETCQILETDVSDGGLAIQRMICAYLRPKIERPARKSRTM